MSDERLWAILGTPMSTHDDYRRDAAIKQGQVFIEIRHKLAAARDRGIPWEIAWRGLSVSDRKALAGTEVHWRDAYTGAPAAPEVEALSRCKMFG